MENKKQNKKLSPVEERMKEFKKAIDNLYHHGEKAMLRFTAPQFTASKHNQHYHGKIVLNYKLFDHYNNDPRLNYVDRRWEWPELRQHVRQLLKNYFKHVNSRAQDNIYESKIILYCDLPSERYESRDLFLMDDLYSENSQNEIWHMLKYIGAQ